MQAFRLFRHSLFQHSKRLNNLSTCRTFANNSDFENSDIQISVTNDGQTLVCLHNEPTFPYEHSKPLPNVEEKYVHQDSVLKMECLKETDDILYNKDYTIEELMRLTYTTKHIWFPNNRWKRKPFTAPVPRSGI